MIYTGTRYWPSVTPSGRDIGQAIVPSRFDGPERGRGPQKREKRGGQHPVILPNKLVSKDLLYRKKNKFSCGIKQEITSRQDRFMLAKLGRQSERRIRVILPASHKITMLHKTEWSTETRTWSHKINRFHILATGCQRLFMHLLTKFNRCRMVQTN